MSIREMMVNAPSAVNRGGAGLMGGAPSMGGGDGGGALPSPQLIIFPWWYVPPTSSTYFYRDTGNQVVPVGAVNQLLAGSEFVVGAGTRAVVQSIALVVQLPVVTDDFIYTMRRNGGPVQGLDAIRNFALPANASVRDLNGYNLQFQPGDTVSWTVTNFGAAAVTVGVSYLGYSVMIPEIERVSQGINY